VDRDQVLRLAAVIVLAAYGRSTARALHGVGLYQLGSGLAVVIHFPCRGVQFQDQPFQMNCCIARIDCTFASKYACMKSKSITRCSESASRERR
jgi:hypothetical protein